MNRSAVLARACAFATFTLASHAAVGDERLVEVVFHHCESLATDRVRVQLALELPSASRPHRGPTTGVTATCSLDVVQLAVDDPLTGKALSRIIDLSHAVPDVRARVVAIAVAELVIASWLELEANPRPRVRPMGRDATDDVRHEAMSMLRGPKGLSGGRLRLTVALSTQIFVAQPLVLWGGGLRVASDWFARWGWAVDVLAQHGRFVRAVGTVAADTITAAASIMGHRNWAHVGLRGGAGFRLGAASLDGTPTDAGSTRGSRVVWATGGPFATLSVSAVPVCGLALELAVEGGYSVFSMGGLINGGRDVAIEGPFIGLQLGVGIFM